MPSPFPGMDPYLEDPEVFPDLHDGLIAELRATLNQLLPAPYYAGLASRLWIDANDRYIGPDVPIMNRVGLRSRPSSAVSATAVAEPRANPIVIRVPHDEFRESFIEIRSSSNRRRLVTGIEILSVTNKVLGTKGRKLYRKKQAEILGSRANLVEIDLLRTGDHTTAVPWQRLLKQAGTFDYHICAHRFDRAGEYVVYPTLLRSPLPVIAIPLLPEDPDVEVDLQSVFNRCYDSAQFARHIDYANDTPTPPLDDEQAAWADQILKALPQEVRP
ncbi:MAG: DUF4058 family protein [Planctomycetaceae bacterium]